MVKKVFFIIMVFFLFTACSYKNINTFLMRGYVAGGSQVINDYSLSYYLNGRQEVMNNFLINAEYEWVRNHTDIAAKEFRMGYCRVLIANSFIGCSNSLKGKLKVKIFVKTEKTGHEVFIGEKLIDMDEYKTTMLLTQAYLSSEKRKYKDRKYWNFEWGRADSFYSMELQDTIYFYTVKLYKKTYYSEYNIPFIEEGKDLNFSLEGGATSLTEVFGIRLFSNEDDFKDPRDNQIYKTVKIGNQVWMAENLRYLPQVDKKDSDKKSRYFVYGYKGKNVSVAKNTEAYKKYGVLYNKTAARSACPSGWHLPDSTEWNMLLTVAGGASVAGTKLKSKSNWTKNGNGTNEYAFNVVPGGYRSLNWGFYGIEDYAGFWSRGYNITSFSFYYYYEDVFQDPALRNVGALSIRCVKDP